MHYFQNATDEDKLWALALFSHKRPKGIINTRQLREVVLDITQMPPWLFEESYQVVGDLAETLALVLPPPLNPEKKSLTEWINYLRSLKGKDETERKEGIKSALAKISKDERLVFFKLLTGGFRVGASRTLILRSISEYTGIDKSKLAHRTMGDWNPDNTTFNKLIIEEDAAENLSRPYPFYLAYALDQAPTDLGSIEAWQAEWKWDGIRSQLIIRGGQYYLWSRGEELLTDKFPEFENVEYAFPDGTVIDGELLPFENNAPLPFAKLQKRIGRKNLTKKILKEAPVIIKAYDLLEFEGRDFRQEPLWKRREKLLELIEKANLPTIQPSEVLEEASWSTLEQKQRDARSYFAEGLMLKKLDSPYLDGRKRGDWWKWKIEPMTIDAVMIYAQKGHGRRADIFSDYTFAVWKDEELIPFAKAYSGLTDKELTQVSRFVRQNTKEKFGPVRTVTPTQVFEIAFEGIQLSSRHKSGVAVRFPRILRWRQDKKPEEANTLDELKGLLELYGQ